MKVWVVEYMDEELLAYQVDRVFDSPYKASEYVLTTHEGEEWTRITPWEVQ